MIQIPHNAILAPNGRPAMLEALENNWYEASRWSPNRSWVWYPVQDAKHDLDRFTRYELMKHARYLYKNSPLMRGLIERMVTLSVGSGYFPMFKSAKNPDWASRAQAKWKIRSRNIHLGHKCSFPQYTRALGRARFLDGECYSIKTYDEEAEENRVQGVEADRVTSTSTDTSSNASENKNNVDGILLNKQGSVKGYCFRGVPTPYDASDVIQHYTPNRLGQYRGETCLAAAINTARDVDDILALEKQCVKDASAKKDIIKTASGELDPETFRSMRYGQNFPTTFNLPADNRTKDDYYKLQFGAQPVVLKTGDEYTPYTPNRPGSAWQGFMEFLSNTICMSTGFPASTILPINIGGTDIRRDLDIAQRVVDPIQMDIVAELDDVVDHIMFGDIHDGDLKDAPDDWHVVWHFCQKINVDRSTAMQDRLDVQAGLMSQEEYHGRYSDDGDLYEQTVVAEVRRRKERISEAGFENPMEFVQYLSLDSKMFKQPTTPGEPPTE